MAENLRIGIPSKGRLSEISTELLADAGLSFRRQERSLFARVRDMPIDVTFLRTDDIPVLCAEGAIDLVDQTVRIALFRITQEAINNAIRHAHADRITVRLRRTGRALIAELSLDDVIADVGSAANAIAYVSPSFGGFSGTVAYVNGETQPNSSAAGTVTQDVIGNYQICNGVVLAATATCSAG